VTGTYATLRTSGAALLAIVVAACSTTKPSCTLSESQKVQVQRSLTAKIAELTDESVTYDSGQALASGNRLHQLKDGRCYAYLFPVAKKAGYSILDGDGGVYIDPISLELGEVFWFRY
jgi:hypothetical protein